MKMKEGRSILVCLLRENSSSADLFICPEHRQPAFRLYFISGHVGVAV